MTSSALRHRVATAVLIAAALDWMLAASMIATDVQRPVAVPLLVLAAFTVGGLQAGRLRRVGRAFRREANLPGRSRWEALERALAAESSPRTARLLLHEPRLLWSVILLMQGRRVGRPAPTFSGHGDALPTWAVLAALSALEVGVTLLLPLPVVLDRILLVLGLWGLAVVLGLIAALVVHPHVIEEHRVLLRCGFWDEVQVPRESVVAVQRMHAWRPRGLSVDGMSASLTPTGVANLRLTLARPAIVPGGAVTTIHLWADDPDGFSRAVPPPSRCSGTAE